MKCFGKNNATNKAKNVIKTLKNYYMSKLYSIHSTSRNFFTFPLPHLKNLHCHYLTWVLSYIRTTSPNCYYLKYLTRIFSCIVTTSHLELNWKYITLFDFIASASPLNHNIYCLYLTVAAYHSYCLIALNYLPATVIFSSCHHHQDGKDSHDGQDWPGLPPRPFPPHQ